jgi:hypothetical protein
VLAAVGVEPSVVYRISAPVVPVVIVIVCEPAYVPDVGDKTGAAHVNATVVDVTILLLNPALKAIARIVAAVEIASAEE